MACPFCNINSTRTRIIKEGTYTYAVLSNPCLMTGHVLIIPKRHVEKISELNKDEQEELFKTTLEFQEKILKIIAPGCDIKQNYRPFQKQDGLKLNHLHIHLLPRTLFDELYKKCQIYETNIFKDLTPQELDKLSTIFSKT